MTGFYMKWNGLTWTYLAHQTIATIPKITKKVQSKNVHVTCNIYWGIKSFMTEVPNI